MFLLKTVVVVIAAAAAAAAAAAVVVVVAVGVAERSDAAPSTEPCAPGQQHLFECC